MSTARAPSPANPPLEAARAFRVQPARDPPPTAGRQASSHTRDRFGRSGVFRDRRATLFVCRRGTAPRPDRLRSAFVASNSRLTDRRRRARPAVLFPNRGRRHPRAVVANLPGLEAEIAVREPAVLRHHCAEHDFSRWVAGVLHDEPLAAGVHLICCTPTSGTVSSSAVKTSVVAGLFTVRLEAQLSSSAPTPAVRGADAIAVVWLSPTCSSDSRTAGSSRPRSHGSSRRWTTSSSRSSTTTHEEDRHADVR